MEQTQVNPEVRTSAESSNRRLGSELLIVGICALAGALLGATLGWLGSDRIVATTLVEAGPGGSTGSALDVSPDVADRYVQTELVHIRILEPEFDAAIRAEGINDPSAIDARQLGTTSVVEMSAEAGNAQLAAQQADTAADVYIQDWRERATADLQREKANTKRRMRMVKAELASLSDSPPDRAKAAGLNNELTRLTADLADIKYRAGGVKAANRMVQAASAEKAQARSSIAIDAALGLLIGAAIGIAILVYRRVAESGRSRS